MCLTHGRLLHDAQRLARQLVLQQFCRGLLGVLPYLSEEAQPQHGHLLLGNALRLELRQLDEHEPQAVDGALRVGHVQHGIVVIELLGVGLEAGVVDQVQREHGLYQPVVLTRAHLLHHGLGRVE